jgi:hypothetical protein
VSWVIETADGYAAYEAERKAAGVGALKDIDKKRRKAEREVGPAASPRCRTRAPTSTS